MGKKCKCPPAGAPEWVLTYGDMMSLLLCFFILLAAMSELKKEDEYKAIVEKVQQAFGMRGGGGRVASPDDPKLTLPKALEAMMIHMNPLREHSNVDDPGIDGKEATVTKVREGTIFVIGGRITFEPGSAELSEEDKRDLAIVAEHMRGLNNKIELRGHASPMELTSDLKYVDLWDLSYARAKAAKEFLTTREMGIRADRIRVVAAADREPAVQRVYTPERQEPNRRVEIVVMESLVEDFTEPEKGALH